MMLGGCSLDDSHSFVNHQSSFRPFRLFQMPGGGNKNKSAVDNIYSWVHKEFKENDIHAHKHRLLCKLDDMSHGTDGSTSIPDTLCWCFYLARTVRSISCHSFPANQRSDSVKRSSTEQQVNPGIPFDVSEFILHPTIASSDLLENALYLTEMFTVSIPPTHFHSSTLSLDSIEKENDRFDLFLYDSLNDESSDDEQYYDCSKETLLLETIVHERRFIEQLTRRCSSMDSLDIDYQTMSMSSKTSVMLCARLDRFDSTCQACLRSFLFDVGLTFKGSAL